MLVNVGRPRSARWGPRRPAVRTEGGNACCLRKVSHSKHSRPHSHHNFSYCLCPYTLSALIRLRSLEENPHRLHLCVRKNAQLGSRYPVTARCASLGAVFGRRWHEARTAAPGQPVSQLVVGKGDKCYQAEKVLVVELNPNFASDSDRGIPWPGALGRP